MKNPTSLAMTGGPALAHRRHAVPGSPRQRLDGLRAKRGPLLGVCSGKSSVFRLRSTHRDDQSARTMVWATYIVSTGQHRRYKADPCASKRLALARFD
jgi:hypothetical protein